MKLLFLQTYEHAQTQSMHLIYFHSFICANVNPWSTISQSEKEHTHTAEHTNTLLRGHWVWVKGVGSHHSQSLRLGHRSNTFPNAMLMCSWWQWCSWREGIHSIPQASKHLHQNTDWPKGAVTQSHDIIVSPLHKKTQFFYTKYT